MPLCLLTSMTTSSITISTFSASPGKIINISLYRASDISRKKKRNFAGFSGANSQKNRPISRDFRGKKVKIRGKIGRFRGIFAGEKSKFAEKLADFSGKKSNFEGFLG